MRPALLERRSFEFRAELSGEPSRPKISGYAVVWNSMSEDLGGFREMIAPMAFTQTLADKSVRRHAFWNHDSRLVLGSEENGSLVVRQDDKGLYFEATPQPTSYANDLLLLMRSGDVKKCSFGFMCYAGGSKWHESDSGQVIRTVSNARLYEVSIVTEPAYQATSADVRMAQEEFQRFTRDRSGSGYLGLAARALKLRHR